MSYALGGIGLPHLDTSDATKFFAALASRVPASASDVRSFSNAKGGFDYDSVRAAGGVCAPQASTVVLMTDLDGKKFAHAEPTLGGESYRKDHDPSARLDPEAWQKLRHWCRVGLRRRDMQSWVMQYWLEHIWAPAYDEVLSKPHGTIREAFVLARIWSTSRGEGQGALGAAHLETEPERRIGAEFSFYNYDRRKHRIDQTHLSRNGVMRRPGVVLNAFTSA